MFVAIILILLLLIALVEKQLFIVNVCVFFMQNFRLTVLTFRVTDFSAFDFLHYLKFHLNHNFKQLKSIGGNLILKVKWKMRQIWCHFSL